jgi:hypothetical protein
MAEIQLSRMFLPSYQIHVKMCSGNGVFTHVCVCDSGFTGPQCKESDEIGGVVRDGNDVLIVTEDIEASFPLAKILSLGGYSVCLLVPTDLKANGDITRDLDEHGIKLQRYTTLF